MELLVFVLCVCAITTVCTLICIREAASVQKRSREQRQAEFLIGAVQKMGDRNRAAGIGEYQGQDQTKVGKGAATLACSSPGAME